MTDILDFPMQCIPEGADVSQYSDRELIMDVLLVRARYYNLARAGEIRITEEQQIALDGIERILKECGYLT